MANLYTKHKMVKHVGKLGDKRCVVIQQLPEELDKVHVVDSDALPDLYHQAIMNIIESNEAQSSVWLGDLLNRRVMPDGVNALTVLYQRGLIRIVPVSSVTMLPRPNQPVPLSDVINFMNGTADLTKENVDSELLAIKENAQLNLNETTLANQHLENLSGYDNEQRKAQARNIMIEAQMLQDEVNKKFEMAYAIDPSLKPAVVKPAVKKPRKRVVKTSTANKKVPSKRTKTA